MAWAFPLTKAQIRKKFGGTLDEWQDRDDIRVVDSIDPKKKIVVVLP
jgi:hypothetical protein